MLVFLYKNENLVVNDSGTPRSLAVSWLESNGNGRRWNHSYVESKCTGVLRCDIVILIIFRTLVQLESRKLPARIEITFQIEGSRRVRELLIISSISTWELDSHKLQWTHR